MYMVLRENRFKEIVKKNITISETQNYMLKLICTLTWNNESPEKLKCISNPFINCGVVVDRQKKKKIKL